MDDGGRRCALTGCDVQIRTASGRPERRYCTAAHRAAARRTRRAVHAQQRAAAAGEVRPGRHRAVEKNLQVTRIAIRVGPGRHAAPTTTGPAAHLDDDAIEERNAGGAARSA
jgi:hypothetical protein